MKGGHGVYLWRETFTARTRAMEAWGTAGDALPPAHPTQKPIALMVWCMERAKVPADGLVLDPYMGSGTTAIAAIRTGRRFVGCELVREHFETAVRRVTNELAQPMLFPRADPVAEQATLPTEPQP